MATKEINNHPSSGRETLGKTRSIKLGKTWFIKLPFNIIFNWYEKHCAMHGAVNIKLGKYWYCMKLKTKTFDTTWPAYFYISPDATPTNAIYIRGNV